MGEVHHLQCPAGARSTSMVLHHHLPKLHRRQPIPAGDAPALRPISSSSVHAGRSSISDLRRSTTTKLPRLPADSVAIAFPPSATATHGRRRAAARTTPPPAASITLSSTISPAPIDAPAFMPGEIRRRAAQTTPAADHSAFTSPPIHSVVDPADDPPFQPPTSPAPFARSSHRSSASTASSDDPASTIILPIQICHRPTFTFIRRI
ncbi:hypothetical protein ACLOJK_020093 [Asimina triloba]